MYPRADGRGRRAARPGTLNEESNLMTIDETMNQKPLAAEGSRPSRRSFLTRAATTAAIAAPAVTLITSRKAQAASKNKLTGLSALLINEVMSDEDQHVPILKNLLDDPDNPLAVPIRPRPKLHLNLLRQPSLQAFLETAAGFENTGSGLYGGALIAITQTQEYFPTAVGLCTVESRHASWLNSMIGQSLVPNFVPVEAPIDQSIVLSRVAEFVADHRSTFPSFDPVNPSDANNFRILDFLLFLEYIESTFYNLNVPLFT
jgi:hypothetical protein